MDNNVMFELALFQGNKLVCEKTEDGKIDLRIRFLTESGEWGYTKKGFRLSPENYIKFVELIKSSTKEKKEKKEKVSK